jgi:hypothetical protein
MFLQAPAHQRERLYIELGRKLLRIKEVPENRPRLIVIVYCHSGRIKHQLPHTENWTMRTHAVQFPNQPSTGRLSPF